MRTGSKGRMRCQVCGSSMPHMPNGPDSCEWNPKFVQLAKDRQKTIEEVVAEVSRLSESLSASQEQVRKLREALVVAEQELLRFIPMLQPNVRKDVAEGSLRAVQAALAGKEGEK